MRYGERLYRGALGESILSDMREASASPRPTGPGRSDLGRMRFGVLGPLEVDAGGALIPLGGPKQQAVLGNLIIRANELVPAGVLIDELWGEDPPGNARSTIQTYVSNLRKILGQHRIEWHAPGYCLRIDPAELDAARFEALLRDAAKARPVDARVAVGILDDALGMWRGPALAGLADQRSLQAAAARLEDLRAQAQEDRLEALLATGAPGRVIGQVEALLAQHPLRERLWGLLMLACYRDGRQAEALAAFERARALLSDELGVDPSAELSRLHERVLRQDPGLELKGEGLRGYRLLEKIGEDPTGVVFRAIQPRVERDVAVKVFHEAIAADPAFVRRFEQEAQAVAALEHPCLVPIYDYWREPNHAYLVSRYLRGGSLQTLADRDEAVPRERAVRTVEQMASALAFAHRQGISHGNLRPADVLLDGDRNAYVAGFPIGLGAPADPTTDVRDLARLVRQLVGTDLPEPLAALCERAESPADPPDADEFARSARLALEGVGVAVPRRSEERNPYKGLRPFAEPDARDFFGRGELVERLVARQRAARAGHHFLAIVGPSGSGKSSVVRAGLVPAVRGGALGDPDRWFVAEMCPGQHPLDELAAALLRVAVRPAEQLPAILRSGSRALLDAADLVVPSDAALMLVIDQFEETFTLTTDDRERTGFLECLRVASAEPDSRLRVVITLRADFYDRPLRHPRFAELMAVGTEVVLPLTPDELEQAIRRPAEQVGVSVEPGLVAEMIAESAHQPGALPLLQYDLTELFERRTENRLTLAAHRSIGGVAGALSARAERILEGTDAAQRRVVKQVFLRLVTLGEGSQDTRRRVPRSELDALDVDPAAVDRMLDVFGRHRFLTFDRDPATREPTVEIAHEALLTAWSRLRQWVEDAREDLRQERRLVRAGGDWQAAGRDASFLLRGARLEQIAGWAEHTDLALGQVERGYLKASLDQRDQERAVDEQRRLREVQTERRSRRRLQALVAVFAAAALVAALLSIVAIGQRQVARDQSARASREARTATARALASAAIANIGVDANRSMLLALEAVRETRAVDGVVLPEAVQALHQAIAASREVQFVAGVGVPVDLSPRGIFVAEPGEATGNLEMHDAATGKLIRTFRANEVDVENVAFSHDGSTLATTGDDGRLNVWDPSSTALPLAWVAGAGVPIGPSLSADGAVAAAAWDGSRVQVLDVRTGRTIWAKDIAGATDTELSPDGRYLAVTTNLGGGGVFDLDTGRPAYRLPGAGGEATYGGMSLSWSPDGKYLASTTADAAARIWDARTGKIASDVGAPAAVIDSVAWGRDATQLATADAVGTVRLWQLGRAGEPREILSLTDRSLGAIFGLAFSGDGTHLLAAGVRALRIWDVSLQGDAEVAHFPAAQEEVALVDFLPDGRLVATSSAGQGLRVWDPATKAVDLSLSTRGSGRVFSLDVSPDGGAVVAGGWRSGTFNGVGFATAWNPATGQRLLSRHRDYDVTAVSFSADGNYLATVAWDGLADIVDRSGRRIRLLKVGMQDVSVSDVRFSPDGSRIAVVAQDRGVERLSIWNWRTGTVVRRVDAVEFVDFDPTGARIVTTDRQGRGEVVDALNGRRLAVLAAEPGSIRTATFSPDGASIAAAGRDGAAHLFDARTGAERLVLPKVACSVTDVAFNRDGTRLASASPCDGVRVWALDIDELLRIVEQRVSRSLTLAECRQYLHTERCPRS